jgi:hypothetical protein
MKNYFDFQLKGKELLPLYLIYYFLYLIPYFGLSAVRTNLSQDSASQAFILLFYLPLILVSLIWMFYFIKLIVPTIHFKDVPLQCDYDFKEYLGLILKGFLLSIITIGIYFPWFYRDLHRYFINNSSWKESRFNFNGSAGQLFLIFFLTFFITMVSAGILGFSYARNNENNPTNYNFLIPIIFLIIVMFSSFYYFYKWRVDLSYRDYLIQWHSSFWPSLGKIVIEFIITVITLGIYAPLAFVRLYEYFADKTQTNIIGNRALKLGYDIEELNDFLVIWGQILLTIITLGIYYPWAFCKITRRILEKSYVEAIEGGNFD